MIDLGKASPSNRSPTRSTFALCLLLLAGLPLAESAAHAAQRPGEVPTLESSPCPTDTLADMNAACFTFRGEENWNAPNGNTVAIPVAVFEAPSPEPGSLPVFFFPGGPGYSSLDNRAYLEQLRKDVGNRTLVTMDHRGFKHAEPALECPDYAVVSPYHNIIHTPAITASLDPMVRAVIITDVVRDCYRKLANEGIEVSQYNAYSVSRDVDEIRRLLGYDRIDAFGSSTGSGTVVSYLQYHPDSLRAAILGWPWFNHLRNRSPLDELHQAKQTFTDALARCVSDDEACRDLLPDWLRSIDRTRRILDAEPYVVRVERAGGRPRTLYFDGAAFLDTLYLTLPDTYAELPSLIADVEAGDYSRLESFFRIADYDPHPEAPDYALGYFLAHICNDMGSNRPTRADSIATVAREPAVIGFEPPWLCAWWGEDGDVPAQHNDPPISDTPMLALHGEMDPCCSPHSSQHLARTMPNVQHVVFQALGHNPVNACRSELVDAFLADPYSRVDDSCRNEVERTPWVLEAPSPD